MEDDNIKKKFSNAIILLIILVIVVLGAGFAYARYVTIKNGGANAQVAKWRFELKDGIAETTDQIDFPVTRTDGKYDVVQEGTTAPRTWGEIPIIVVTTGTEVHMKYDIDIVIENCPTNLKFYKDANHKKEFTTIRTGLGEDGSTKTATITIEKYIDKDEHKDNGEHEHIIYWYWPFETGKGSQIDENDLIDSDDMKMGTATIAITATGMQVLELQDDPDYVPDTIYALFEKSTGTLKLSHSPFENYAAEDTYYTGVEINVGETSSPKWYSVRSSILNVEIIDEIRPKITSRWFFGCVNLKNIDLTNLDTSNVTSMYEMFYNCTGLNSLDLNHLDTSNVTNMYEMFYNCSGLKSIEVSGLDTSNITDMRWMFYGCSELTSLNLSEWNVKKVINMTSMFRNCSKLSELDISGWDTNNVTNMGAMFLNCNKLTTIYTGQYFNTNKVTNSSNMFLQCTKLKGGNGTTFNSSKIDKEYARIDTDETPGYFTKKD